MDSNFSPNNNYARNSKDVNEIIKHAKLNIKNLTEITQALYYPSENVISNNFKLLELDNHIENQIREGQIISFKGGSNEKVVLCTDEKTYEIKAAEISNSLLIVPNLKLAADTSTSPLKSPKSGNNSLDRSLENDEDFDVMLKRKLEHRPVLNIFHEYIECREIRPRFRKLYDLLQLTRYSGPENEYCIEQKYLFTFDQLLNTIQSSRKQFLDGIRQYRVIELDNYMRILEYEYEYRILNLMLALITENSWQLNEIDKNETLTAMEGIAPYEIVERIFDIYTEPSTIEGKFLYREDLVSRIIAQNILQPNLKFRIDEFLNTWQEALPDGMKCEEKYLRGLAIIDKNGSIPCIRSLVEDNLPTNIYERMTILFKCKEKWTIEEIEPYIEFFTSPTVSVSNIVSKYARSFIQDGIRYYVAKHS